VYRYNGKPLSEGNAPVHGGERTVALGIRAMEVAATASITVTWSGSETVSAETIVPN